MIKDKLKNAETYYNLSDKFRTGFEWLKKSDLINIQDGKYEIADGVYANVQSYYTKEDALFEAHRKYADIQYMIKGCEKIGISEYTECETCKPYDAESDIEFFNCNGSKSEQTLNEGEFFIFFPQDTHQPSLSLHEKLFVKKTVVKVLVA